MTDFALLVPGGRGQLGSDLVTLAERAGAGFVHAPGSAELDITDADAVADAVSSLASTAHDAGLRPVVINAAAYTAVDAAETDQARAHAVNADGPANLAASCAKLRVPFLHVSTDYVFPGDAERPYEPNDETGPRTAYGRTKLSGERAVLDSGAAAWVVRTAWVYGAVGANFVKTMAKFEGQREQLSVVGDQHGCPTWSADLARGLLDLAALAVRGEGSRQRVLHAAGGGETSWCGFAKAIFEELGADPDRVSPCTTADFPRPAYSVLSQRAWQEAGLTPLRPWREALAAAFAEHGPALRP